MSVGIKPLTYNSLWQLRNDTWSSLEESATQLALAGLSSGRSSSWSRR